MFLHGLLRGMALPCRRAYVGNVYYWSQPCDIRERQTHRQKKYVLLSLYGMSFSQLLDCMKFSWSIWSHSTSRYCPARKIMNVPDRIYSPSHLLVLSQIFYENAMKELAHNKLFHYIAGPGRRLQHGDSADGPHWTCTQCTFQNHPLLDKCETCEMPRLLLGTDTCYCHPIPSKTFSPNPVVMHVEKLPPTEQACELWSD